MVKVVQAVPDKLDAFSKKCKNRWQESETVINKAISEVESVRTAWGGDFAKAFGQAWAMWQKEIKEFPIECQKTATEMTRLAGIYREADEKAKKAVGSVSVGGQVGGQSGGR